MLFASTFSTHVSLGDAPESVSGIKTAGVLHAPGYPSYVAVGRVFGAIAFGGWEARVNAFSLVCAALMIGGVFLLARGFGSSRAGAALGSFALATSASFWFNAGFAKHYAFSGLLVTLAALAVVRWQSGGRSRWLIAAGVLLGAGAGSSWELSLIMAVGIGLLVLFGERRARLAVIGGATAALVGVAVLSYVFLVWRARQHPAVNWGEVTSVHRLVDQVSQQDFRAPSVDSSQQNAFVKAAIRIPSYLGIVTRDLGLAAAALALFGAVFGLRGLNRGRKLFLAAVAVLNLLAVAVVTGIDTISGFLTGLVAGGYVLDLLIVLAVLIALGIEPLLDYLRRVFRAQQAVPPLRAGAAAETERFRATVIVALFLLVLAPSILVHYRLANHRQPPLADNYAKRVLEELPQRAVLFVYQADLTFPIVNRQAVFGDRRDVSVIVTTSLQFEWYREQIDATLHRRSSIGPGNPDRQVQSLIDDLHDTRPVYIDAGMMDIYRDSFKFRPRGLVGEVVKTSADTEIDRDALAAKLIKDDRDDSIAGHAHLQFPNAFVHFLYGRAHIELAKQFAGAKELEKARTEIARSLDVYPEDPTARLVLQFSGQPNEDLNRVIRVIQAL